MQTEGKMQSADYRGFNRIALPFPSLRANRTQANRRDIQSNWSADRLSPQLAQISVVLLALDNGNNTIYV